MSELIPLETKVTQWGNFARLVHETEPKLHAMKEAALATLSDTPSDTTKIVEYEGVLANAKKSKTATADLRQTITSVIDKVKSRLMQPEKDFDGPIATYEAALIAVKKTKASHDATIKAKNDEIARIREGISNHIANQHAGFESAIVTKVLKCFEHCLTAKLTKEEMEAVMPKMKAALTEANFTHTKPAISLGYVLQAEVDEIWEELTAKNALPPSTYLASYHGQLINKFEFYEVSIKNASAAIDLEKKNVAETLANIAEEKANAEVAAKLDALAPTTMDTVEGGKALKCVYALDMEDSEKSAMTIVAAFAANWATASKKVRVKKWLNLSVSQMGDCLVAIKNEDERFSVTGINFKQVEKL